MTLDNDKLLLASLRCSPSYQATHECGLALADLRTAMYHMCLNECVLSFLEGMLGRGRATEPIHAHFVPHGDFDLWQAPDLPQC